VLFATAFELAAVPCRRSFEQGFLRDMAAKLGIDPARISILAVTPGRLGPQPVPLTASHYESMYGLWH
jgi:hypothetical protein